jgi:hypothetical protein
MSVMSSIDGEHRPRVANEAGGASDGCRCCGEKAGATDGKVMDACTWLRDFATRGCFHLTLSRFFGECLSLTTCNIGKFKVICHCHNHPHRRDELDGRHSAAIEGRATKRGLAETERALCESKGPTPERSKLASTSLLPKVC